MIRQLLHQNEFSGNITNILLTVLFTWFWGNQLHTMLGAPWIIVLTVVAGHVAVVKQLFVQQHFST